MGRFQSFAPAECEVNELVFSGDRLETRFKIFVDAHEIWLTPAWLVALVALAIQRGRGGPRVGYLPSADSKARIRSSDESTDEPTFLQLCAAIAKQTIHKLRLEIKEGANVSRSAVVQCAVGEQYRIDPRIRIVLDDTFGDLPPTIFKWFDGELAIRLMKELYPVQTRT